MLGGACPSFCRVSTSVPSRKILANELGDIRLDDPRIRTRLAIIAKRVDTGSPWIVSNLPDQPYWNDGPDGSWTGNRHYRLAAIVRASTAAPYFFGPEPVQISDNEIGTFVDGGVTPYNNPSLPLLMLATMSPFGLSWPTGPENLSITSIGTGVFRHRIRRRRQPAALFAANALEGLIADGQSMTLTMMQWLGQSPVAHSINSEIGDLGADNLGNHPLFAFQRFDVELEKAWLKDMTDQNLSDIDIARLRRMDGPAAMKDLYELAKIVAQIQIAVDGSDD